MTRPARKPRIFLPLALLALLLIPQLTQAQQQRPARVPFDEMKPAVGDMAIDFTLKTLEEDTFTLSDALAKGPVVIEFGSFT